MSAKHKPEPAALIAISQDFGIFCAQARNIPKKDRAKVAQALQLMADTLLVAAFENDPFAASEVRKSTYRMIEDNVGIKMPLNP